jgi:hypothetical protein
MSRTRRLVSGIRTELTRTAVSNLFSLQICCGTFTLLFVYKHLRHRCIPGKTSNQHVISDFRRLFNEIFGILRCYAAYIGGKLPTFRGNLPVPSWRVKDEHEDFVYTEVEAWNRVRYMSIRTTLYVRFGDSVRTDWSLKMGRKGCPETSANNYKSTMRNILEEWKPCTKVGKANCN